MKKISVWHAALILLVSSASLLGHHALTNFDTTKPVRVKGTVVQVNLINPHSFIYLEEKLPDGSVRRWAVEGPSVVQIDRKGLPKDFLKYGDTIEICGYAPKDLTMWQIASPNPAVASLSGRLL